MKTQRNWAKITVFVVLALTSLSSIAMTVPHRGNRTVYITPLAADVCGEKSAGRFDQYMAAIDWAERGGGVPLALSVNCIEESLDLTASRVDLGGESGERFEQYMAAIEGRALDLDAAPVCAGADSQARFDQVLAATEWAERGGQVPLILSESCGEVTFTAPSPGYGGESWARFEQYMAAIESTGH